MAWTSWYGAAVTPLLTTHWSCCSLALGQQYQTHSFGNSYFIVYCVKQQMSITYGSDMEARLSCWLVLLSVNTAAGPGGQTAGFPWPDPSHMQVLYCHLNIIIYYHIMSLTEFVYVCLQFACMYCWICLRKKQKQNCWACLTDLN